jgi:hypothetical protein
MMHSTTIVAVTTIAIVMVSSYSFAMNFIDLIIVMIQAASVAVEISFQDLTMNS